MFSFINFATVIVFLVTMFDDSTQLVTVPRSSPDPIAELCRALVVLKRERYHIREVFKLSSDGHTEKVYWYDEKVIEPADAVHYVRQRALAQYLTDSGHAGLLMEDDFEPLEEQLKRTTDWLASKDESRFEELYTAYAAGLYAAQTEQLQNKNNNTQEV